MKIVVVKCGGSILNELSPEFFSSLKRLVNEGYKPICVHGGGPDINQMLELYNIHSTFHNGLRQTDGKTMRIVETALSGITNRRLVEELAAYGLNAIGLSGSDGLCFQGTFINEEELGFVGEITNVKSEIIELLIGAGFIPVITPIAVTEDGTKLNVNADYAAAALAEALNAEQCLFVTNVEGIIIDGGIIPEVSGKEAAEFIQSGKIYGGMIPKVESALAVVEAGLESVRIVSGSRPFYEDGKWLGTKIGENERVLQ